MRLASSVGDGYCVIACIRIIFLLPVDLIARTASSTSFIVLAPVAKNIGFIVLPIYLRNFKFVISPEPILIAGTFSLTSTSTDS